MLLVQRAYIGSPWHGAWCAPGGFCEVGEHPIETAEREVLEETGLRVTVTGYIGVWVDEYADEPGQAGADVINVAYYSAVPTRGAQADFDPTEVSEVCWFAWEELPRELAPPGTLAAVLDAVRAGTPMPDRVTP